MLKSVGGGAVQKVGASAIPFIIAPTGSMANNGAITLGTALSAIYANAWINLPANAIQAGSAAGWYFCQMTSTTVGTVFNNTYTAGTPTIPTGVPFVTTGPGAYTGVITAVVGPQITIPAGAMGPNGVLKLFTLWSALNNANAKTLLVTLGGATLLNPGMASVGSSHILTMLYNRGSAASNISMPVANNVGLGTAGANPLQSAINTAVAQTLGIGATLSTATDYLVMESYLIEVLPG